MLKVASLIRDVIVYRYTWGKLVVACAWCRTVEMSDEVKVVRRTGLAVLPPGWDRVGGTPLCPLCVSLYCTDRPAIR
ncbi:hypothetical protein [Streptomyces sp. SAI-129]|uniref:hypothetical protein n=1 Tax=Streptomyces sp. SAI-129 TaxID=3377727 RepID=UPI003C7D22E0